MRPAVDGAQRASAAFRALGDEKRLRIVERLSGGSLCVCDLAEEIGAKQPLLSFHLKTLREAGVVVPARKGKWIYYSLNERMLGNLEETLARLREACQEAAAETDAACC